MNDFSIGYMTNSKFDINNAFIEQVHKCMNNKIGTITQPLIRDTVETNRIRVLALLMFYETRKYPEKDFKVFSCVIYTTISHYVCIDCLACESKK